MNKLTLAVAAYNIKSFIGECVGSIQAQTVQDFDLLVIDDGATDGTGALLDELAAKYPKMKVLHQVNAGISAVRNRMYELCETPYLWTIDGDDTITPDAVEKLLPCLDGTRDMVVFGLAKYGQVLPPLTGKLTDLNAEELQALRRKNILRDDLPLLQHINANSVTVSVFRVETLRKNNLCFDTKLRVGEDVRFLAQFLYAARNVAYLDASLYLYRVNEGSVSLRYCPGLIEANKAYLSGLRALVARYYPEDRRMADLVKARALSTAAASMQLETCHPDNKKPYGERKRQFKELMADETIADALRTCPRELNSRNVKLYRVFMPRGWFFATNAFARLIMAKRYWVFGRRGGKK